MKVLIVVLLSIFLDGVQDLVKIGKINAYKKSAITAYQEKRFKEAEQYFTYLRDTLKIQEDEVLINLGHTYLQLNQPEYAAQCYENVLKSRNKINASLAANHLGVLSYHQNQDKDKAKSLFKEALRQNPENTDARHNLEWISKLKEQDNKKEKKDNQENKDKKEDQNKEGQNNKDNTQNGKDSKNKEGQDKNNGQKGDKDSKKGDENDENTKNKLDANNPSNQNKEKNGKSRDEKNQDQKDKKSEPTDVEKQDNSNKNQNTNDPTQIPKESKNRKDQLVGNQQILTKMGMTDQRAKALLDAMKASEVQYIQQMKKENDKPKRSKNKPDW